jgi:hypothetical protein
MNEIHEASTFPNGKRKSELYNFFLTHWDFACTQKKYEWDLELIRAEETQDLKNCRWSRDSDGQLVVSGLDLRDKGARVLVTRDGFTVDLKTGKLVFISYAREDLAAAALIKDAIDKTGMVGWLDVRYLYGGVRWKAQITRMIQKSDFFVPVLSKLSVEKRGFVQREIREGLESALSVPDSRIFIVPVRLDHCAPTHPALQELSWVDLFPDWDAGIRRLIQSLHAALGPK